MNLFLPHRRIFRGATALLCVSGLLLSLPAFGLGGSKTPFIGDSKLGGFWGFLGVETGWSWLQTRVDGEADKQGMDNGVAAGITYYRRVVAWELGARLNYKTIRGVRTSGTAVAIDTLSLAAELGLRFRFGEQFQVGPFFQYVFGSDLSYRPANLPILTDETGRSAVMASGISWVFETRRVPVPMRLGVRLVKYLNVPNRSLVGVQLTYQIGFRLTKGPKPKFIYNTRSDDEYSDR